MSSVTLTLFHCLTFMSNHTQGSSWHLFLRWVACIHLKGSWIKTWMWDLSILQFLLYYEMTVLWSITNNNTKLWSQVTVAFNWFSDSFLSNTCLCAWVRIACMQMSKEIPEPRLTEHISHNHIFICTKCFEDPNLTLFFQQKQQYQKLLANMVLAVFIHNTDSILVLLFWQNRQISSSNVMLQLI